MKRFDILLFVFLLSVCLTIRVMAEEALTWEDCLKEAMKNHPDLISGKEKVKQAEADKDITRSPILPQVTSELSGKRVRTEANPETDTYSYRVTGRQLVFDGFKTASDVDAASETIAAQRYDYAVVSSNIRLNLRKAFASLLRAQELISLTEEIAERRNQNVELVRLRYEAGREHRGALLTAEADLAEAEFEVAQAKRNLSLAHRESFLKKLIAKKESARFSLKSAKSDFFPQVYLNASFGEAASDWPPKDNEWSAGLTVSFPIFEGGSRIARVSKSKSLLKQSQADERSGRDGVILTLEETWRTLQDTMDNVSVQKKFLEAARERAKIASAQYSTGLITFDDWIIIENNLVIAKKAHLNAQANLLVAEADWIQAKGGTLEYVQE